MGHADVDSIVTLMDPVCGGDDAEIAAIRHLLATTTCEKCGPAAYDVIRLSNAFPGNLIDAWHLYNEVAPRIEAGELELDIDPEAFARIALLTCPRILEKQPSFLLEVVRAAVQAALEADINYWARLDLMTLADAWRARSYRFSGDYDRALALARRTAYKMKGVTSPTRAELSSVHASCLHDLGKPHRAIQWCRQARYSFKEAGLYREGALQLLIEASIVWEFWRHGKSAELAVRQCLEELPSWDHHWRSLTEMNLMRYEAEQGRLESLRVVQPFENKNWEFRRVWTYGKAYRALGKLDLADQAYCSAKAMVEDNDAQWIEVELDYCGLLVQQGRISEACLTAEQAAQQVEKGQYRDYFAPVLRLLRKAVARRLISEEVFRYLQRRATSHGLSRSV